MRDESGASLGGADVLVGQRGTTTSSQGLFRIDSLRPGQYIITIRLVGYSPVRSRIAVVASEPTQLEYFLTRAPLLLPTMVVKGHRSGIYGSVGDTAYRAAVGARVQLEGQHGLKANWAGEFPRTLETDVLPVLRKQNGFQDELAFVGSNGTDAVSISMWDRKESADAYGRDTYPAVLKSLDKVIDGTPKVETYEVSTSTFHKIAARN